MFALRLAAFATTLLVAHCFDGKLNRVFYTGCLFCAQLRPKQQILYTLMYKNKTLFKFSRANLIEIKAKLSG